MGTGHWREGGRGEERTPHSCVALLLLTGRCAVSDIQGEILGRATQRKRQINPRARNTSSVVRSIAAE